MKDDARKQKELKAEKEDTLEKPDFNPYFKNALGVEDEENDEPESYEDFIEY